MQAVYDREAKEDELHSSQQKSPRLTRPPLSKVGVVGGGGVFVKSRYCTVHLSNWPTNVCLYGLLSPRITFIARIRRITYALYDE